MIKRKDYLAAVEASLKANPVTAILGPRQCGKTTLALEIRERMGGLYLDLEDPSDMARLTMPSGTLQDQKGLVVIDEVQRKPDLFPILRSIVDRRGYRGVFLLLGSASPDLVKGASETLAGRIGFVDLAGFNLGEVGHEAFRKLWLRGGYPRSYLAADDTISVRWRTDFIRTFLERDIPQLGIRIPAETIRRFWMMSAHYHGQIWNAAELARSLACSENTARHYLDILSGAYMLRRLLPWFENLGKRQTKSPKVYVCDSGILHTLLRINDHHELLGHPKFGASWEGFVVEQLAARFSARDMYYWRTLNGAELDVLLMQAGARWGFEIKATDSPSVSASMRIAIKDLALKRLFVVHPGTERFPLAESVEAIPVASLPSLELA